MYSLCTGVFSINTHVDSIVLPQIYQHRILPPRPSSCQDLCVALKFLSCLLLLFSPYLSQKSSCAQCEIHCLYNDSLGLSPNISYPDQRCPALGCLWPRFTLTETQGMVDQLMVLWVAPQYGPGNLIIFDDRSNDEGSGNRDFNEEDEGTAVEVDEDLDIKDIEVRVTVGKLIELKIDNDYSHTPSDDK